MDNDVKVKIECPICGGGVVNDAVMKTSRGMLDCEKFFKRVCYYAKQKGKTGCVNPMQEQLKDAKPESISFW